jgi:eukaryotic-like serine/threonine-protein kinase
MRRWRVWFQCIAKAVCAQGLRALAGVVPLGDVLFDVAGSALERLREQRQEDQLRLALQDLAQASPDEVKEEAAAVVREVAPDQPPQVQQQLDFYLSQIPALVRQSLKRPADPSGTTVPASLALSKIQDILPLLPARLPRFRPGEQPPGIGDWELVELLGVGGFGEVWKAKHRFFDGIAPVALKFCLDATARDRLLKYEASVLNQVMRQGKHPGIVPLLDAHLSMEPPCLKYEYIEGGDLSGLLRDWQALPSARRFELATQVVSRLAQIVGYAHRLNPPIVHRDLKPANVLIQRAADGDYLLRVTDFGIGGVAAMPSILEARHGTSMRGGFLATALRGSYTPLYASPQQMRGDAPDVRDDVHALGVIWYQLLTGDLSSGSPTGLWADELEETGLSKEVIRLLGACVSPRIEKRPADATVLAEQLAVLLNPPAPPAPLPPVHPTPPARTPEPPAPPPDRLQALLRQIEANPFSWVLDLTNKQIGDIGVTTLASWPHLGRVSALYLSGNLVTDAGAAALASSPHVGNLTRLILWENLIGDDGAAALAACPHLVNLTALDLGSNRLGDRGVIALAASPHLVNLTALILVSNHIGDDGARALAASPHLDHLAELKLLGNHISSAGVTALKERFGKRVRIY